MDKSPIDIGHTLKDILQTLAQIMAIPETDGLIEDDIDLDIEFIAGMVGLQALDVLDGFGEAHGEVEQDVALVGGGGGAGEVADVGHRGAGPVGDDVEGEEEAAEGVEVPDVGVVADCLYISIVAKIRIHRLGMWKGQGRTYGGGR